MDPKKIQTWFRIEFTSSKELVIEMSDSLSRLRTTLDSIENDWVELVSAECNPLDIALSLLNSQQEWEQFQKGKQILQTQIRSSVNEHYLTFNDSVGVYGIAEENFNHCGELLVKIKSKLNNVQLLVDKRNDLMIDLNLKNSKYNSMLRVLETIEQLNEMISQLNDNINSKNFDISIKLINDIKSLINVEGISKLESLQPILGKLGFYSDQLFDLSIDEISNLIYAKSTYVETAGNNSANENLEHYIKVINGEKVSTLYQFQLSNFKDIKMRLDLCQKLGREAEILKSLVSRTENEINKIIQSAIEEVKRIYPTTNTPTKTQLDAPSSINNIIVYELFKKVFERLSSSFQRHILIYEIVKLSGNLYNIEKIWLLYSKKIGLLICHYIINENIFQEAKEMNNHANLKIKSPFVKPLKGLEESDEILFQFNNLNLNKSKNDLINSLNDIFFTKNKETDIEDDLIIGIEDFNHSSNKLDILVIPNIFNMGEIIDNFIKFITEMEEIYPFKKNQVMEFFDNFMNSIFIHQLETWLFYEFENNCSIANFKSIKSYFRKVLTILDTSLHFKEKYCQLVFNLLGSLFDKFFIIKTSLLGNVPELTKMWYNDDNQQMNRLTKEELDIIEMGLLENSPSDVLKERLIKVQTKIIDESYKSQLKLSKISPKNFIPMEYFSSIIEIIGSLNEIGRSLPQLKRYVPEFSNEVDPIVQLREIWSLNNSTTNDDKVFIALNNEYESKFELIIKNFNDLMNDLQLLLRYEIKYECLYCIKKLLEECDLTSSNSDEISKSVDDFCDKINYISRVIDENNIGLKGKIWIFAGLGSWIDKLIIKECKMIKRINKSGWIKIMINLRVLQQLLRKVDFGAELLLNWGQNVLSKSLMYYNLGSEGGDLLVSKVTPELINQWGFTKEELSQIVKLLYFEGSEEKRQFILEKLVS